MRQASPSALSSVSTTPGSRRRTASYVVCSPVATSTLSIDVSAPSVSPAASRCWVARDRARSACSCRYALPTISAVRSSIGATATSSSSRRYRYAMRCQKHDERSYGRMLIATAQPPFSSPSMRSAGTATSSKNTSANSCSPLIISIGETVMPGVSMSTRNAVMPRWRESGAPVRVSSTQRSEYCARLVHTFWPLITPRRPVAVGDGPARERRQVAAGARLGEALAPEFRAREQAGDDLGRELGRREVDEGRREHLDQARRGPGRRGRAPASAAPSSVRSIGDPPRPPTRSGQP